MLPTLCAIGATGAGKGSTLNSCFRSAQYSVGHMFVSDTTEPVSHVLPWRGTGGQMRGVDLCGFSDSQGRDSGFIEAMVSYLKNEVQYIHCFLLLFNSQEPRIGIHLKDMLLSLKAVFGPSFMRNVMVAFTRWEYTKRASVLRRGITKEVLATNVNSLLREVVGHDHDCDCVFIDNTVNTCADEELRDLYGEEHLAVSCAFDEALDAVRAFALGHDAFHCAAIEGTLAARDVGRDKIDREEAAIAKGKIAFEELLKRWDAIGIMDPDELPDQLRRTAEAMRDELSLFVAAKTKPDLDHVGVAVLDTFDTHVSEKNKLVCQTNLHAALSFNSALRMQLVAEYRGYTQEKTHVGSRDPLHVFQKVQRKDCELISRYIEQCQGGSLALGQLFKMQEDLRLEQFVVREKIFGQSMQKGNFPELRRFLSDAASVSSYLDQASLPEWFLKLLHSDERKSKCAKRGC